MFFYHSVVKIYCFDLSKTQCTSIISWARGNTADSNIPKYDVIFVTKKKTYLFSGQPPLGQVSAMFSNSKMAPLYAWRGIPGLEWDA